MKKKTSLIRTARAAARAAGVGLYSRAGVAIVARLRTDMASGLKAG